MSKLNFPLVLFAPASCGNAVVIVESFSIASVCGKASLNISWRFNDENMSDFMDADDHQKIESYITRYIMERVV